MERRAPLWPLWPAAREIDLRPPFALPSGRPLPPPSVSPGRRRSQSKGKQAAVWRFQALASRAPPSPARCGPRSVRARTPPAARRRAEVVAASPADQSRFGAPKSNPQRELARVQLSRLGCGPSLALGQCRLAPTRRNCRAQSGGPGCTSGAPYLRVQSGRVAASGAGAD